MYEPSYLEALKHSFKLIWNNKSFWIFGILSALFISPLGLGGFWGQIALTGSETIQISYFPFSDFFRMLSQSDPANFVSLVSILEIILAIFIITVFLSVCAQTSLIYNICEYYKKKKHSSLNDTWHKSYKYFWKILGFDLIRKIILVALTALSAGLWFMVPTNDFWNSLFLILSFTLIILIIFTVSSSLTYASGYAVIEGKSFWQSFKKGILLFKDHFLVSLEISLVMMLLDMVLAAVISMVIILSFIPVSILWFFAGLFGSITLLNFVLILDIFIITIAIILIGGFYNAFNTGAWMYLFMKMHHVGIFSKVGHLFNKIFQR